MTTSSPVLSQGRGRSPDSPDHWCRQVMRSRMEPMTKVAKPLRGRHELILNYFRAKKQLSSRVVEGLNNKVKVTMRKCYGFGPSTSRKPRCILHLGNYRSRLPPTNSTDEPRFLAAEFRGSSPSCASRAA